MNGFLRQLVDRAQGRVARLERRRPSLFEAREPIAADRRDLEAAPMPQAVHTAAPTIGESPVADGRIAPAQAGVPPAPPARLDGAAETPMPARIAPPPRVAAAAAQAPPLTAAPRPASTAAPEPGSISACASPEPPFAPAGPAPSGPPPAAPALVSQRKLETPSPVSIAPPPSQRIRPEPMRAPMVPPLPSWVVEPVPASASPCSAGSASSAWNPLTVRPEPEETPAPAQTLRPAANAPPRGRPAAEAGIAAVGDAATAASSRAATVDASIVTPCWPDPDDGIAASGHAPDPFALIPLLALSGGGSAVSPDTAVFADWAALARRLGGEQGKAVRVEASLDAFARLPAAQAASLRDIGMELVANAVMHGIESMSIRRRVGKNPVGTVRMTLSRGDRDRWLFCARDDGRGVDLVRVRAALVRDCGYTPLQAARLSEREAIMKVFEAGVTTAPQERGARGRGAGLPNVIERLHGLGARLSLLTVPGRSTEVRIAWPAG